MSPKGDACWYIVETFSFSASTNRKNNVPEGTTSPGTKQNPAETGLYYLQSRYYDPKIGRFINADSYASTGHGILGYNMFTYCYNSPVHYRDDVGNFPFRNEGFYATSVDGHADNRNIYDKWKDRGVVYVSNGDGSGGRITNSYLITNGTEMAEYAKYLMYDSEYASDFAGSLEGFCFEWEIHNIAFLYYSFVGDSSNADRAKHLDIGRTIYNDSHGIMSHAICALFCVIYPEQAVSDYLIFISEE